MKLSLFSPQKIATLLLTLPIVTLISESPRSAEDFRGRFLSGTITCSNPTATSTRVDYSLVGDAISTFLFVIPGSSGTVRYLSLPNGIL